MAKKKAAGQTPARKPAAPVPPPPAGDPAVESRFRSRFLPDGRQPGWLPAGSIRVNPKNWRTHPEYQTAAVRAILERVGWVTKLIVRELPDGTYELLDGHLRQSLAADTPVPVVVCDLTDQEADEILATFDNSSQLAVADNRKLSDLLGGLKALDVPLAEMGWPDYRIDQLAGVVPPAVPLDPPAGSSGGETAAPSVFPAFGEDIKTEHCCPKCGYKWSGKSS